MKNDSLFHRSVLALLAASLAVTAGLTFSSSRASAAIPPTTLKVTSAFDSGPGTLRERLAAATAGDIIVFSSSISLIDLRTDLVVTKDVTIQGPGPSRLELVNNENQLGNPPFYRLLTIRSGRVAISGLTLQGGRSQGNDGESSALGFDGGTGESGAGGAILNLGDLTLRDCALADNLAVGGAGGTGGDDFRNFPGGPGGSGGPGLGGAICNSNRLTLVNCTLWRNACLGGNGGFGGKDTHNWNGVVGQGGRGGRGGLGLGGAIFNTGELAATNCTIYSNPAHGGWGGDGGEGISFGGPGGDGGDGRGGALFDLGRSSLVSCTITTNSANPGYRGGPGFPGLSYGAIGRGEVGGIDRRFGATGGYLRNTIIAGNKADDIPDLSGAFASGGFNLVGVNPTFSGLSGLTQPSDQVPPHPILFDPFLGTFGDYGGSVPVLPLRPGSRALDRGHRSGTDFDQRGMARGLDDPSIANASGGDGSDIGAYESCAGSPALIVLHQSGESSVGVLREAIDCVAPGGTIRFTPESNGRLKVSDRELVINKDFNLIGAGAEQLIVGGGGTSRVFTVLGGRVNISGLTIGNGYQRGANPGEMARGGGILNLATLTVSDCRFVQNTAGGAYGRDGTSAARSGGPGGHGEGGAIFNGGTLTLLRCLLDYNSAYGGQGGQSVIGGNAGGNGGDGGHAAGGAVCNDGDLTVLSCTLYANSSVAGTGLTGSQGAAFDGRGGNGGNAVGGAIANRGNCTLINATLTTSWTQNGYGNDGDPPGVPGSALGSALFSSSSATYLLNTLIASNTVRSVDGGAVAGPDVFGPVTSQGHNFISMSDDSTGWVASDLRGSSASPLEPGLGPLQDNGGKTFTRALRPGSPALDAGDDAALAAPYSLASDQRGGLRKCGSRVDIGAFEIGSLVRLTDIRRAGAGYDVSFTTEPGWPHHLESVDALPLVPGPWNFVPNSIVIGTGGKTTVSDSRPPVPHRFFRVSVP